MSPHLLKLLMAGEYVCPVRYRDEFETLQDPGTREVVDAWLLELNMRLARVGQDGAFFMSPSFIGPKEAAQLRGELLRFRDEYGSTVELLNLIRQSDGKGSSLSPGEYVALFELEGALAQSSTLEGQFKAMLGMISNAALRSSNHENLRRMLDQLAKDGYVVLASKENGTYQITGKIEQLYAVLQFLDENKSIADTEIDERQFGEEMEDLVAQAQADEMAP